MSNKYKKKIEMFERATKFFSEYFGLQDWEIVIESQAKDDVRASCYHDVVGRVATICWSASFICDESTSDYDICKTAFHEILELYLAKMYEDIKTLKGSEYAQEQTHIVIRMLENKMLPLIFRKIIL